MGQKNKLTEEDKVIIALRSVKESQGALAKEYGVSQPAICKMLSKKEQRDIVKKEMARIVAALPDIIGSQLNEIKLSQQILHDQLDPENASALVSGVDNLEDALALRKYCQTNERDLLKSMGVIPSQTSNYYIQQIYNDHRNQVISEDVLRFLGMSYEHKDDDEEVEIIEEAEIVPDGESGGG